MAFDLFSFIDNAICGYLSSNQNLYTSLYKKI